MRKKLTDAEILLGLAGEKGLQGVHEKDMKTHLALGPEELQDLARKLESEGMLRILSFAPLFCVSRSSIDFLGGKIVPFIRDFHGKHPKESGIPFDKLKKRFDVSGKILLLTLKTLVHEGRLRQDDDGPYAVPGFVRELPPREEKILAQLESLWLEGGLRAIAFKDIRDAQSLAPHKLQALVDILIERKKVVQSKEGFFLHASWLDEVVANIRATGRKELSIAEFKELTGLSRKFAIPLLELLDEMGVTRRRGATREIL
jgi:selenocysteine-specific elongation factor